MPGSEPMAVTMAAVKIKARVSVGLGKNKSLEKLFNCHSIQNLYIKDKQKGTFQKDISNRISIKLTWFDRWQWRWLLYTMVRSF